MGNVPSRTKGEPGGDREDREDHEDRDVTDLGASVRGGSVACGCRPAGTALARLAGGLDHSVFTDGGDGSRRNVAAFLLQKEVQFTLIVRVHLVALAGVIELSGTEGAERPSAGSVQRPPAGGQGTQAAARRHGQGWRGGWGRGGQAVKTGAIQEAQPRCPTHGWEGTQWRQVTE